jgi:hypothetical protein
MTAWQALGICVSLIVGAIIISWKSFFTGYGNTIGTNLATSHDIALVLDNLRKQRHEDMKRDAALDIMRVYGTLLEASLALFSTAHGRPSALARQTFIEVDEKKEEAKWDAASAKFQAGMTQFWQQEQIARLIFPESIQKQLEVLKDAFLNLRARTYEDAGHFHSLHRDLTTEQENLSKMIRAELQI